MLAMQNIETLNGMGVKKIVTQCPHRFNTLMNEYPQLGGNYEVVHHSQFLEQLVADGSPTSRTPPPRGAARVPRLATSPPQRRVPVAPQGDQPLGGVEIVEAPRNGTRACAAAGGARCGWRSPSASRSTSSAARSSSPPVPAAPPPPCPFCYIAIDDGVKGEGLR